MTSFLSFFFIIALSFWPFGTARDGVILKKSAADVTEAREHINHLRVLLVKDATQAKINTTSPYTLFAADGRILLKGTKITGMKITSDDKFIWFGTQPFSQPILTIETVADGGIKVNGKEYRHRIEIVRGEKKQFLIVNEIPVDDYLKGVLPWEANPKWKSEALEAQAIISRTYALFNAILRKNEKYDVVSDVKSQVYEGKRLEHPATDKAIEQTRGQVLVTNGKIFPAYFHSTCGGATTRADLAWDVEPNPSLMGVQCGFCAESKHYRWKGTFTVADIQSRLKRKGVKIGPIKNITRDDVDASGRARSFVFDDGKQKVKIHSNDFRMWMDPFRFKSTLMTSIEQEGSNYLFSGKGWGHGVGLCQYGMKQLAELGYSTKEILQYYYPKSEIKVLESVELSTTPKP